ncbi:MAG: LysR family transcriptional regulator [Rhodobiaceae bacterium]|nr:LysR family transcriptional regulator [Rhodobiaceae bacterium]MCC0011888.1 LysR family transcriptional regulator [Rhodobiaceae bacterium]MCC0018540.1 LysR family transcriptional regulator [Rhodobiaceae bacterium]MCC0050455.1 LysR family transcriptional regulator [Rhodobiaceae bacterium]MCC0061194.1 LysR family transcriptional regulator [Rhodobiaceae bacterium]
MDWDKLRVFHAAAGAGSFTHAGETLGLSQSAVSRQVGGLEEDLGVPLFHRHARGLILTEQGEMLYRSAQRIFSELEATRTRLTDSREKPSGELRVTTTVGLGSSWLTPRLKEFLELYPDISLSLILRDEELDLSMREADIALRLRQPTQPDLIQRRLFTVHFHAYASPEYTRRHGALNSIEDLDDHRVITFGQPTPSYLRDINWLVTIGRSDSNPRKPFFTVNNVHGLKRAVENGLGIAILPDYVIDSTTNLVRVLPDADLPAFDTYFVYPAELRDSARVNVFRDFLLSKARGWSF